MRSADIQNIDVALRLYYTKHELGNKEITELFGKLSSSTIAQMKNEVLEKMDELQTPKYRYHTVNTEVAYDVWGINVAELERKRAKLIKLGLLQSSQSTDSKLELTT